MQKQMSAYEFYLFLKKWEPQLQRMLGIKEVVFVPRKKGDDVLQDQSD